MPLPLLAGRTRMRADLVPYDLDDPQFERPAKVFLRPLLSVESDMAEERAAAFSRRHVTGGYWGEPDPADPLNRREWIDKPEPLVVDGETVTLCMTSILLIHQYAAMQGPMWGEDPPEDQDLFEVGDLVEAVFMHEAFWRGLCDRCAEVRARGLTGEAWNNGEPWSHKQSDEASERNEGDQT